MKGKAIKGFFLFLFLQALFSCAKPEPQKAWLDERGTDKDDFAYSVAVDSSGNAYAAGSTGGALAGENAGFRDVFLAKYDPSGGRLWLVQHGTSAWEEAYSTAVDGSGNVYVAGYTFGNMDGQERPGLYDLFLMKFDREGNKLWVRLAGTPEHDYAYSVAVDSAGNAYVAGYTEGALGGQQNAGGADIFLLKFDPEGNLIWSRQMGTPSDDIAYSVAVEPGGGALIAGYTGGGLDGGAYSGSWDAFLVKFDAGGNKLWSKQLGTPSWDEAWAVAVDGSGNAYLAGYTGGDFDGLKGAGAFDIFLVKFDRQGNKLWVRLSGTPEHDYARSVAVDAAGNAYVAGYTEGALGAKNAGGADPFVLKFDPDGKRLWAFQTGSPAGDYAFSLAVDPSGSVYAAGETSGGLDGKQNAGAHDLFVLKANPPLELSLWQKITLSIKMTLKKLGVGK